MNVSLMHRRGGILPTLGHHIHQVRHMGKQAARLPKPKLIKRMVYDLVTEPLVYRPKPKLSDICPQGKYIKSKETGMQQIDLSQKITLEYKGNVSPYEQFLMKRSKKLLDESKIFAVCLRAPISGKNLHRAKQKLKAKDFFYVGWGSSFIMRKTLPMTKYVHLMPLCITNNAFIASRKSDDIAELMAILKKVPEFTLIGMKFQDRILNIKEVEKLAKTSVELQRGEFVSILNMAAGQKTHSLLNQHQQMLAMNLEQYIKQCRENNPSGSPVSAAEQVCSAAETVSSAAETASSAKETAASESKAVASESPSSTSETKTAKAAAESSDSDSSDSDSDSDSDKDK